ncbi:MAG: mannose-1-phosphate guanylyltransferase/mannose-6-phosphate isomerase, partial [Sinobacterium sp.]|nr:mannose-1-phosphate guanylyltransferase/mannose-6-phosphate isomerase [Sinobacterium sp.]
MIPVILSGGSGTRLWPYSRSLFPKQFLPLVGETTMLQSTVQRLAGSLADTSPIVVCNN